jgi:hypothetical protein
LERSTSLDGVATSGATLADAVGAGPVELVVVGSGLATETADEEVGAASAPLGSAAVPLSPPQAARQRVTTRVQADEIFMVRVLTCRSR